MRPPLLILSLLATAALLTVGCGGIAVIDPEGAGGSDTTSSTSNTTNSSSTGGPSALELTWVEALASANCQPVISEDPLRLSIVINADNSAGASNATISVEAARVVSIEGTTEFKTNPTDVIISAGAEQNVELEKLQDSGVGTNGCDYCNALDLQAQLDLLVDGAPVELAGNVNSISCAF